MCRYAYVGDKIIAKKTDVYWGFRKGDTLEVVDLGVTDGHVIAKNLTRPNIRKGGKSILAKHEYRVVVDVDRCVVRKIKFLGITIYKEAIYGFDK